jgi:4-amino-4-deoxy-L-arabinose transferase-like glycosyltransferase
MLESFESYHLPPLFAAAALFLISIVFFQFKRSWSLISLILGGVAMGFFMANLDPFLNTWDEQQHALVAKNMLSNPFKPMLYTDPLYDYDRDYWIGNHVWLHKQPLFLWQMAASIKIFGANVLAVRLPSVLMHALIPYFIYRMGKIVANPKSGFIAAFIFALLHFPLELIAGRYATDHNDVAFLFYTTWSIMCLLEYHDTKEKKWLYLMGIAAGCAVLVKWLIGLFVFGLGYLIQLVRNNFKFWKLKDFLYLFIPFTVALIIFLPWQIYIFNAFPLEAATEFSAAAVHFGEVVEGHGGNWSYHFTGGLQLVYGTSVLVPFLLLISIIIGIWKMKELKYKVAFAAGIAFVYGFFSIAATKMAGFTLIVTPLTLICVGMSVDLMINRIANSYKKVASSILIISIIAISFLFLDLNKIGLNHAPGISWENANRQTELDELNVIIDLRDTYSENEKVVVFNANITLAGHVQYMFFTNFVAYPGIPSASKIKTAKEKGYQIVIIDRGNLTDTIIQNSEVEIFSI